MAEQPIPEIKFPLTFEKCPSCGSTRRIAGEMLKQEQAKGKLTDIKVTFLFRHQSLMANPSGRFISAPMIHSFYDTCVECGTVYCIVATVQAVMPGMPKMNNKDIGTQHMT